MVDWPFRLLTSHPSPFHGELSASLGNRGGGSLASELAVDSELQGVASPSTVDQIAGDLQAEQDFAQPGHVVTHLLGVQSRVRPCLPDDLSRRKEAVGVGQKKLQELELAVGQALFLTPMADHPALGVDPEPLEVPEPLVPQIHSSAVAFQLVLDDDEIVRSGPLSDRFQLGQITPDPIEEAEFELDQVGVDAHPMPSVLPVIGPDVLALKSDGPARTLSHSPFGT